MDLRTQTPSRVAMIAHTIEVFAIEVSFPPDQDEAVKYPSIAGEQQLPPREKKFYCGHYDVRNRSNC